MGKKSETWRRSRTLSLLETLLELGDSTSRNLTVSFGLGSVTFSEETITEVNLLEIARRNIASTRLEAFSKKVESTRTGADWEWHIIGKYWTLKLRVQAKKVDKEGKIHKLKQRGKKSTTPQDEMLICASAMDNCYPVYCFYCAEEHRHYWRGAGTQPDVTPFLNGCLLAPATEVKARQPKRLVEIEEFSFPWHFLWTRNCFAQERVQVEYRRHIQERALNTHRTITFVKHPHIEGDPRFLFPSVRQLNDRAKPPIDTGISKTQTDSVWRELDLQYYSQRDLDFLLMTDVSEPSYLERISP